MRSGGEIQLVESILVSEKYIRLGVANPINSLTKRFIRNVKPLQKQVAFFKAFANRR